MSDLAELGTDPLAALNFIRREVVLGELGERLGLVESDTAATSGGFALAELIRRVKERRYADYGLSVPPPRLDTVSRSPLRVDTVPSPMLDSVLELRRELDGYRKDTIQAPLGYRARPLNGVWATPPFLHNGSVPTLYQLLSPQDERPDRFYLGSRLFDAVHVGFYHHETPGGFEFDTSLPGNSNHGHLFQGDETSWRGQRGVLGPELEPSERLAVIEYLKFLPPLPARPDG